MPRSSDAARSVTLDELEHDPHAAIARLRAQEPVAWVPALRAWLVTSRELVVQAMRDDATFTVDDPRFSTAQVVGPSMLSLDGPEHRRHRDPFARPFRLDAVTERFTALVEAEVDELLDAVAGGRSADLRTQLAGPLSVEVMVAALGLEETDPDEALGWYAAIVAEVTAITAGRPRDGSGAEAFGRLRDAVARALDRAPSSLVAAAAGEAGVLSRDEVASNAAVLLFGGIETTEAMIASAFLHLLSDAAWTERVRADPALLPRVVEESLRLEPAAAVLDRYATRDTRLGGADIAKGDLVTLSLAGANRDPSVFPQPHAFDPGRENLNLQVAFAHGPHVCLGMHLARLETRVALGRALERLQGLRLDQERRTDPRGLVFRKPPSVHVLWDG